MKKILFLIILLLLPNVAWGACTGSSPNWSSSGDYASVSSCASQASAGDTITVTGNATWDTTLELTRGVNLVGSGTPVITRAGVAIYWTPSAAAQTAHDTLSISGFTFDGNDNNMGGAGIIRVYNNSAANYVNLVVKNNTIRNISSSGRGLYLTGTIYGVAASNTFDKVAILVGAYGLDYNSWNNQTQAYGVAQNFYLEDNTIQFSANMTGYIGWIESGQGGRIVVRYNTYDYSNITDADELWDVHGLQTPTGAGGCTENYSTMVAEYYGNKIIDAVSMNRWMFHRGGWLAMFYNSFTGTYNPPNQHAGQYYCNSTACSGSYDQKVKNTYIFRNLANGNETPMSIVDQSPGCPSDPITENTDLFNYSSNFTGATGVGCGTLANRPGTCTTGTAYWATTQSCSDMTGMIGTSPSTPISGTLYKCTATNTWTEYYKPYRYPYLPSGETDVTAPTNDSNSINAAGTELTMNFSESVKKTGDGTISLTCSGGAVTATYASGTGSAIWKYTLNRTVNQGEVCTVDYTQAGSDIEDIAGNDLETFSPAHAITNGSTQQSATTYELSITVVGGGTVNSSQGGIQCTAANSPCTKTCDSGTVLTLTPVANNGWKTTPTWSGTGCGTTTTMSAARTCTATFAEQYILR